MKEILNTYDWQEAFCGIGSYGREQDYNYNQPSPAIPGLKIPLDSFSREDVEEIHGISEGENDELDWIIYGQLKDKRYFYLEAGCDYTGWD